MKHVVPKPRDLSIDTLRGIAIVLMVAGHVIGTTAHDGMQVADDSPWRAGYRLLADLRIPLFTALSGFVYGRRPIGVPDRLPRFAWGKVRRLLVPLVTVGTAYALLQTLALGSGADADASNWWRVYFFGMWHFWFLQAIFLLLLGLGISNAFGLLRSRRSVIAAILVAAACSATIRVPSEWSVFSINGAIKLAPFLLLGYAFAALPPRSEPRRWILLVVTAALFAARSAQILSGAQIAPLADAALGLALGLVGISTLIAYRSVLTSPPLARLGYFSFAIYLLHVFGTAPTRMALQRAGIDSEALVFVLCLAAGLALPVLFEITLGRIPFVSWAVLGQKPFSGMPGSAR